MIVLGSSGTDARYADSRNLWRWTWNQTPPNSAKTDKQMTLSPEAKRIHESALVIDGHNDLMWEIREKGSSSFEKIDIRQPQPKIHTDIPRLKEGNVGAQFWSVYVPATLGDKGTAFLTTLEQIALVKKMVEIYPDQFELATTVDDIERISKTGKVASLIGVEGGHCIQESLANLNHLYDQGARYMTLTHSKNLSWADSSTDDEQTGGLSPFGVEVVQQMNRLGMMVDISHVSPKTMHAAMDVSKAPIIFSHSSARSVADSPRNVPDDVLKRVHDTEGLVMVNFYSAFVVPESAARYSVRFDLKQKLIEEVGQAEADVRMAKWDRENPMDLGTINDVLDHIDHLVKVAGWEHVGLGADFDGVDALPVGLEDVSRYPYITQGLLERGYTEEQIRGILGENLMRVMRKVEEVAAEIKQAGTNP
ncbi:membrane dipeptidase [Bremerella cremea]|uniref:Membrane dipeptidase n=2 Tax=Bremerella cremea TaxID=1031537 RepID=A0A368KNL1_9BACT|nr:membrane dipeptidase [Bremerella cremea]